MRRQLAVIAAALAVVALPFIFRQQSERSEWREGDPVLVVISPHNEAIRREFAEGFSAWHRRKYGVPVKTDWRVIGGTTEIMRYLESLYSESAQAWWKRQGHVWPTGGNTFLFNELFDPKNVPATETEQARFAAAAQLWHGFRQSDNPGEVTSGMDLFFGGGTYDHSRAAAHGFTVPFWPLEGPATTNDVAAALYGLMCDIPRTAGGESWWNNYYLGTVLSTFGICYNPDRLRDLGIAAPPRVWRDLADPAYLGQVGVTDPTKSGSVAKAFEMIIHEQCALAVQIAGFTATQIDDYERKIAVARLPPGEVPPQVPVAYQEAIEQGWTEGIKLVRLICANARYFTDGAGKVPVDVGDGIVAAGIAIDFYGRFQAEAVRSPAGAARLVYVTPHGGSSVSADPLSILRGAPHRELALRFALFVMSSEGQQLWNYRVGTPGGPHRFALCRLPIAREFYPAGMGTNSAAVARHCGYSGDDLTDPEIDAYAVAARFAYQPRWTGRHFGIQRDLVRALCLDAGDELRAAWRAIRTAGGPAAVPQALALLQKLPDEPLPLTWRSAISDYSAIRREERLRAWTASSRANYRQAEKLALAAANINAQ